MSSAPGPPSSVLASASPGTGGHVLHVPAHVVPLVRGAVVGDVVERDALVLHGRRARLGVGRPIEVRAAEELVGAGAAAELVGAGAAVEAVLTAPAAERVRARAAADDVVAGTRADVLHVRVDVVVLARGSAVAGRVVERDDVVGRAEDHGVDVAAAVDLVRAGAVLDPVVPRPAVEHVAVAQVREVLDAVVARAAAHDIPAAARVERVVARAAVDRRVDVDAVERLPRVVGAAEIVGEVGDARHRALDRVVRVRAGDEHALGRLGEERVLVVAELELVVGPAGAVEDPEDDDVVRPEVGARVGVLDPAVDRPALELPGSGGGRRQHRRGEEQQRGGKGSADRHVRGTACAPAYSRPSARRDVCGPP
jgi:hypothetical protein